MESPTSQQAVIDPQELQQLQDELQQEISESINNSNLSKILEKHGISKNNNFEIRFQCSIEVTQIQSNNINIERQAQGFLQPIPAKRVMQMFCCMDRLGRCVPCP
ncbi:hypothetical protein GNF10_03470 [Nostoc sp. UCD121]|uniref:hypothetical protein n=1 Tax=Nostoc sp. UCD121 TaxID=2681305 RepID=UPI001626F10F|nr:hypothetical protein [Nostoc sp. UCD121]MBC1275061.1 hypothetical protein [Nostoc sp. UCD121]MBC1293761.1 hypothetical protein [Nostoc sp. UCD122]